jgi:protoporphyrinogen oxidase
LRADKISDETNTVTEPGNLRGGLPARADVAVIGAGPAGLTAAFELARLGRAPIVLEASDYMGGISRTHRWEGNRLDIGGHRFFTKSAEVKRLWAAMMDEPMLKVPRLSRIYHGGKFFRYPLQIGNTLANLGLWESFLMVASYLRAKVRPELPEETFEQWVRNRFGDRLYRTFFKTYTEKVWGISCTAIRADWAAQRIHGLSFVTAVLNALRNSGQVKSLITTFDYPRLGPGMLWESAARKVATMGGSVVNGARVTCLRHHDGRVLSLDVTAGGATNVVAVDAVLSTMPLAVLARQLDPQPPAEVLAAADGLKYRDFLIVALACRRPDVFPDNWIYIHTPEVRVGRIQNFRNWSPDLVASGNGTTLGMEYFCSRGDDLWNMADGDLIALAKREITALGLVDACELGEGHIVRELNAYPVYDAAYREHVDALRAYFTETFTNLQTAGRNGLHRYNNQDHSMLAGQHAAFRLMGRTDFDPWEVNTERSYYEEQVITPDSKHEGTDILVADKAPPHENV